MDQRFARQVQQKAQGALIPMDVLYPYIQSLDLALAALRGPTREMVERMRGEWISTGAISCKCSKCNHLEPKYRVNEYNFCPYCMSAMTNEAVDMMLKRMEEMTNEH